MSALDPELTAAKDTYKKSLAASLEEPKLSRSDAFLSGILQLVPALAGFAIAKKRGALGGLQGGALGAQNFLEAAKSRSSSAQKKAALEAQAAKDLMDDLSSRKEKLEDKEIDKEFSLELEGVKEQGRNARASRTAGALSNLGLALSGGLKEVAGAVTPREEASISLDSVDEAVANIAKVDLKTPEGKAVVDAIKTDPKNASWISGLYDLQTKSQNVVGQDLENKGKEKGLTETDLDIQKKSQEVEKGEILKSTRLAPRQILGMNFEPNPEVVTDKDAVYSKALTRHYTTALSRLEKIKDIVNSTSFASRSLLQGPSKDLTDLKELVAAALKNAQQVGTEAGKATGKEIEIAQGLGPELTGFWSNLLSLSPTHQLKSKAVDSFIEKVKEQAKIDMGAFGYNVSMPKENTDAELKALLADPAVAERLRQELGVQ